jgi:large-conductance mechanosensitive channel
VAKDVHFQVAVDIRKREEEKPEMPKPPPEPSNEERLLTEIRDLLREGVGEIREAQR